MAINPSLLIAAPVLQDSFVEKDGSPMSAGIVTCYADNSRTTLKNWYYQTGTPGNYTYVPLPNPLTLSGAGTICDANGVDTIPFFYPFSETLSQTGQYIVERYYITIVNHAMTNQITRANFPYNIDESANGNVSPELDNLIINNGFWQNIVSQNLSAITDIVVAPSQHDGFQYPDIHFLKTNTSATDALAFTKFPQGNMQALTGDVTPEFYVNHVCSVAGSGETQKCYQFPISLHVNILANFEYTVTIQALNNGGTGTGSNVVKLFLLQDTGTGTTPPAAQSVGQITLSSTWTKYSFTGVFPATSGLTLGSGSDDGWYLQVQMPLNLSCNINFTRPSLFLAQTSPTNSFLTYDQVDSVVSLPRTGDIRISINSVYPIGWLPLNEGTIGLPNTATFFTNVWPLYKQIWSIAKPFDSGATSNPISQMYTSIGAAANYGTDPYTDFVANKILALTKTMGRVILGTAPIPALPTSYTSTFTASSSTGLLITTVNTLNLFVGMTVNVLNSGGALPGNLVANAIYYVTNITGATTFHLATTFANALAGTAIAFSSAGTGTQTIRLAQVGATEGEYAHTQLLGELAAHQHGFLNSSQTGVPLNNVAVTGATQALQSTTPSASVFTDVQGSSNAFNVTQPGVFYNMFIKL
jgi:hypothetical protein